MEQEAAAVWAKSGYVGQLPDPSVGTMFFAPPMHFEPDRQLAEMQFMQMIPWLGRLKAETRQAQMEALAAENLYRAERLRVIGDIRANWFKLYVLAKQVEITEADQEQLQALIRTANARVATGVAQPGDVLMATLEYSSLQEQLLTYRQQIATTTAELNRLLGRDASVPIAPPTTVDAALPPWSHDMLRAIAFDSQPELIAAQMRTAATRWGIEVARLERRPDLTFGATWMIMDAPGALMEDAGKDSWVLGVTTTLPIWDRKYDAMTAEASREHYAAHASADEVAARVDALLLDLWEQAMASHRTVQLYEESILPQARQTFEADQQALVNNTVTFDRVVRDYRTLLNLELGYHRALAQLATVLARIRQAVGADLAAPVMLPPT
jgi:outer membrane protein TolC